MKTIRTLLLLVAAGCIILAVVSTFALVSPEQQAARSREAAAKARRAEVAAQTAVETKDAAVFARRALYGGVGVAGFVLLVGGSYAVAVWATRRASEIHPTKGGQFPLVRVKGRGFVGVVDPNRAPSSVTVFRTPTLFDTTRQARAALRGQAAGEVVYPQVAQPTPLSEGATLALAGQATAAAMVAGATRHPSSSRAGILPAIESVNRPPTLSRPFPAVEVVEDADHIDRLLQLAAPDDYFDAGEP